MRINHVNTPLAINPNLHLNKTYEVDGTSYRCFYQGTFQSCFFCSSGQAYGWASTTLSLEGSDKGLDGSIHGPGHQTILIEA